MNRRRDVLLIPVFAGVIAALLLQFWPWPQRTRNWSPTPGYQNLKHVALALQNYCSIHGTFPYHLDGPDHALYLVSDVLPASCFDLVPDGNPAAEAYWDHTEKRLVNGDVDYLNAASIRCGTNVVIAAEKWNPQDSWIRFACSDARIDSRPITETESTVVGSWWSTNGGLFRDRKLWEQWEQVQLPPPSSRNDDTVKVVQYYKGDHLQKRVWSSPHGQITETVETDDTGLVIGFTREPEDWESFWPWKRASAD